MKAEFFDSQPFQNHYFANRILSYMAAHLNLSRNFLGLLLIQSPLAEIHVFVHDLLNNEFYGFFLSLHVLRYMYVSLRSECFFYRKMIGLIVSSWYIGVIFFFFNSP